MTISEEPQRAEATKDRVIAMLKRKAWNAPEDQIWCVPGVGAEWRDDEPFTYWMHPITGQKIDLVEAAQANETGPMLWLALTGRCADYLRQGHRLPTQFRDFAAKLMLGEVSRPKARSHSKNGTCGPFKLERRNFAICVAMAALGPPLDKASLSRSSASEIVAALVGLSPGSVFKIWERHHQRFSQALTWELAIERLRTGTNEHEKAMEWLDRVNAKRLKSAKPHSRK